MSKDKNLHKIPISSRVDLWVADRGFQFTNNTFVTNEWQDWDQFKWHWQLYTKDGIVQKVKKFLDWFSDHSKNSPICQGLKFEKANQKP